MRGEVHLSLMPAGDERFQWRALSALYVLAVFPETHRLGRQATLEIAELADTPLLLLRRDFGSRQWFDAVCATAHIRPRALLESGAPHTLIALVQSGYGSRSFRPIARCPAEASAWCPSSTAEFRSADGPALPGTLGDSFRRTRSGSWRSW